MTTTELEALVGHLFIVGGRTISASSPGAIAMPPPRRPARGRDTDTLFGLVSLSKGEHQSATFYEELTESITSTFFKIGGSVTAALRESINTANQMLLDSNQRRTESLAVGFAAVVLREQEIYVAIAGPARCLIIGEDYIERLPSDEELHEGQIGLGLTPSPDMRFYRREIRAEDFLVLADTSFNRLTDETLHHAVSTGQVDDALTNFAAVSGDFAAAEVIKFVSPLGEGETDDIPETRSPAIPSMLAFEQEDVREKPSLAAAAATLAPAHDSDFLEKEAPARIADSEETDEAAEETDEAAEKPSPKELAQKTGHRAVLSLAQFVDGTKKVVEGILPGEDDERDIADRLQLSPTIQIGVAVAIAVLVALITTAIYRYRGQTSRYAQLVREAQSEIELAREGGEAQAEARPHWELAVHLLEQAVEIRSSSDEIERLRAEALSKLDSYDHVTRVSPVQMRTYDPGAYLRGPVIHEAYLYVIDRSKDILYREDLDETGTQLVNRESMIITRQGELIGNQVVGGLIDLIWLEEGGVPQRNVLAALSRNGLLITYSPSEDVSATLLPGFEAWRDPRAIAVYDRNLYILDAGANEIWRYEAGSDAYTSAPQRYFSDIEPTLDNAVDLEIDPNGNIYVLHADGNLTKYFFGRPEVFEFSGMPHPLSRPTALYLNLSVFDRMIFIADPGWGSIYTTALNGTFLSNLKDTDDSIFNSLTGIYSIDRPPLIYFTTGNALYYFSRP